MIQCEQNCDPQLASPEKHLVKKISETVLTDHKVQDGDVSFIFGSDELLASLKKEFFQQDHWTDVIAFRLNDYKETHVEEKSISVFPERKKTQKNSANLLKKKLPGSSCMVPCICWGLRIKQKSKKIPCARQRRSI